MFDTSVQPHVGLQSCFTALSHETTMAGAAQVLHRQLPQLFPVSWAALLWDAEPLALYPVYPILPTTLCVSPAATLQLSAIPPQWWALGSEPPELAALCRLLAAPIGNVGTAPFQRGEQHGLLLLVQPTPAATLLVPGDDALLALLGNALTWIARTELLLQQAQRQRQADEMVERIRSAIAETFFLEQVLEIAAAEVSQTYHYALVGVFLHEGDQLRRMVEKGQLQPPSGELPLNCGITGRAVRCDATQYVADVGADPDYYAAAPGVCAEIAVPLRRHGDVCGVLNVDSFHPLTTHDVMMLERVATEIGHALDRGELFAAITQQARQLVLLEQVRSVIAAKHEFNEVCDAVVQAIVTGIGHRLVALYLLQDDQLHLQAFSGYSIREHDLLPLGEGMVGRAMQERQPLWSQNVSAEAAYLSSQLPNIYNAPIISGMYVPLIHGDTPVGVLMIESPNVLSEEDWTLLQTLGGQIAASILHAQLFAAEAHRRQEFEAIYATMLQVNAGEKPTALLDVITQRACELLHCEAGLMYLSDTTASDLVVVVSHNASEVEVGTHRALGDGAVGLAAQKQRTLCINDYQQWAGRFPLEGTPQFHALLAAPLLRGKRMLGVLCLNRKSSNTPFTPADQRLIELFAAQAAQLIERAQLLDHERRRRGELELLQEISVVISGKLDLTALLQTVVEKTAAVFNVSAAMMLLRDETSGMFRTAAAKGVSPAFAAAWTLSAEQLRRLQNQPAMMNSAIAKHDDSGIAVQERSHSSLCTSIMVDDEVVGALLLFTRDEPRHFTAAEWRMAVALGQQVAQAYTNARRYERERMLRGDAERSVQELRAVLAELEHARDKLLRSEKLRLLGELASGVAHDFKNALATVIAHTQLLLMDETDDAKQGALQQIEAAAHEGGAIVRRILEFAHPQQEAYTQLVDINAVIRSSLQMTSAQWHDRRLDARIQLVTHLKAVQLVRGNITDLGRMLVNLLVNALDAMSAGGRLVFATCDEGSEVVIKVHDTGSGMPPEVLAQVFEPFYTTKAAGSGTGLGLSICHQIVTWHGGSISVASHLGVGTQFVIRLPALRPMLH